MNHILTVAFFLSCQMKVSQGVEYKLEESVTMETELIELRAKQSMMSLQVTIIQSYTQFTVLFFLIRLRIWSRRRLSSLKT